MKLTRCDRCGSTSDEVYSELTLFSNDKTQLLDLCLSCAKQVEELLKPSTFTIKDVV